MLTCLLPRDLSSDITFPQLRIMNLVNFHFLTSKIEATDGIAHTQTHVRLHSLVYLRCWIIDDTSVFGIPDTD
jgi:hypothetical protein